MSAIAPWCCCSAPSRSPCDVRGGGAAGSCCLQILTTQGSRGAGDYARRVSRRSVGPRAARLMQQPTFFLQSTPAQLLLRALLVTARRPAQATRHPVCLLWGYRRRQHGEHLPAGGRLEANVAALTAARGAALERFRKASEGHSSRRRGKGRASWSAGGMADAIIRDLPHVPCFDECGRSNCHPRAARGRHPSRDCHSLVGDGLHGTAMGQPPGGAAVSHAPGWLWIHGRDLAGR